MRILPLTLRAKSNICFPTLVLFVCCKSWWPPGKMALNFSVYNKQQTKLVSGTPVNLSVS